MWQAVEINRNVQLRDQRTPIQTPDDWRTQHIGRFDTKIGLNTADQFTAIPQPLDLALFHL